MIIFFFFWGGGGGEGVLSVPEPKVAQLPARRKLRADSGGSDPLHLGVEMSPNSIYGSHPRMFRV